MLIYVLPVRMAVHENLPRTGLGRTLVPRGPDQFVMGPQGSGSIIMAVHLGTYLVRWFGAVGGSGICRPPKFHCHTPQRFGDRMALAICESDCRFTLSNFY